MLPATVVYVCRELLVDLCVFTYLLSFFKLIYLVIVVALKKAALPTIALIMLAVTYGLQVRDFFARGIF